MRRDVQPVGALLICQSLAGQDRCRRLLRDERGGGAARAGGSVARLEPLEQCRDGGRLPRDGDLHPRVSELDEHAVLGGGRVQDLVGAHDLLLSRSIR